ncbi:hypothetical protein NFHSH190041_02840 [Shewanella sp. NFH-SH190041]|uniref:PssE/Cps14G family polysaccharide biosynthesis glycosyltransferase n=1 Tax=Shewanella sp. NFH-SH190041 TaxID=2950245 RepID=UPI0021C2DDD3|nr:PssE/Cps14G family polysaccharide biosynthesis glycosyltransferase [Shewanella sp. NFH-SH190041]BDM62832.1 hypothetical protein NFHSH190041_02840 [Shewanella sp. NFH-SH190041]
MRIFVTVGTTSFDKLIEIIDEFAKKNQHFEFVFQIADGIFKPQNGEYFKFTEDINSYYNQFNFIITHAGAGSIYKLLELNKNILVVPNLYRVDKHQSDISNFVEKNNHALVCWKLKDIDKLVNKMRTFSPRKYKKISFFKKNEILNFLSNT